VVFGLASEESECPEKGSAVQFAARAGVSVNIKSTNSVDLIEI